MCGIYTRFICMNYAYKIIVPQSTVHCIEIENNKQPCPCMTKETH